MNLRHLRTFVAIAEAGGVHRAVPRLNLSQPAASRQLRALEAELGVPLFDRIGRELFAFDDRSNLLKQTPPGLQGPVGMREGTELIGNCQTNAAVSVINAEQT